MEYLLAAAVIALIVTVVVRVNPDKGERSSGGSGGRDGKPPHAR